MIPKHVIDDILAKADIVTIISSYLNVVKRGNRYVALCPFHNDSNPSLSISPSLQIYKCFVCNEGGNVFNFVSKYEKISYFDAVKKVAKMINYTSSELDFNNERKVDEETKDILQTIKDVNNFYRYVITTDAGKRGYDYFISRNIDDEMINYFSLGYSPENGSLTVKQLRAKNHSIEQIENAGLLIRKGNDFRDRFQGRIIFPIYNEYSEIIGFSARKIDDSDEAKFINSPATKVFNKSRILYNYQNAESEARKVDYLYIVEGFMDVFAFYHAGIKACIALMGTAFTKDHAKILRRLNVELRLCLDGDNAGQHGILLMTKILDEYHVNYKIVNYRGDKRDPDEIFQQDGKEKFLEIVNNLQKKNDFILNYFLSRHDLTSIDGRKEFITDLKDNYNFFDNDIEKKLFLSQISELTKLDITSLKAIFEKKDNKDNLFNDFKVKKHALSKIQYSEQHLLSYMLESMEALDYIKECNTAVFIDDIYMMLANYIIEYKQKDPSLDIKSLINLLSHDDNNQELINLLTTISSLPNHTPYSQESADEYIKSIQESLKEKEFSRQYKQAEASNDMIAMAKILNERLKNKKAK